jgi:serine-type D-Ala-D-Ala carboxypeptidase (penicillin-binding protein 5/6)
MGIAPYTHAATIVNTEIYEKLSTAEIGCGQFYALFCKNIHESHHECYVILKEFAHNFKGVYLVTQRKSIWLRAGMVIGTLGVIAASVQMPAFADTNASTNANSSSNTNTSTNSTTTTTNSSTSAFSIPQPPTTKAQSVVLMDADSGQVLYAKDADQRRAPASTTKLMTMYLLEKAIHNHQVSLTDEVPVTPDAYQVATEADVSDAYLDPREHFTVQDMLKFIAVISANDATVAVADKLAGDKSAFVNEMNAEAKALGLTNTHFENPDGLPVANHYMSARDLATLAKDLVDSYPDILQYTSLPNVTVRKGQTWPSTDDLVGHYPGLDGLKTGYTADAGYCYVGTAKQNGVRLIVVVMADTKNDISQRFRDAEALLDYGFHNFTETTVARKGTLLTQTVKVSNGSHTNLQVSPAQDLVVDLPTGVKGNLQVSATAQKPPIKKGQAVGTLNYVVNGQAVTSVPIVAAEDDNKAGFFTRIFRGIGHFFGNLFHRL